MRPLRNAVIRSRIFHHMQDLCSQTSRPSALVEQASKSGHEEVSNEAEIFRGFSGSVQTNTRARSDPHDQSEG